MVTGQIGKDPKILIWTSRPDSSGALQQLCQIHGDHKRAIVGLSFSSTGQYIATMGKDKYGRRPARTRAPQRGSSRAPLQFATP